MEKFNQNNIVALNAAEMEIVTGGNAIVYSLIAAAIWDYVCNTDARNSSFKSGYAAGSH